MLPLVNADNSSVIGCTTNVVQMYYMAGYYQNVMVKKTAVHDQGSTLQVVHFCKKSKNRMEDFSSKFETIKESWSQENADAMR